MLTQDKTVPIMFLTNSQCWFLLIIATILPYQFEL